MDYLDNDAILLEDCTTGWPGIYWIDITSAFVEKITYSESNIIYRCNPVFDEKNKQTMYQTHAVVRAMNWWNDLFWNLSHVKIFK